MTDPKRDSRAELLAAREEIEERRKLRNVMRELEAERRIDARIEKVARLPRGVKWLALVVLEATEAPKWAAALLIWTGFLAGMVVSALYALWLNAPAIVEALHR